MKQQLLLAKYANFSPEYFEKTPLHKIQIYFDLLLEEHERVKEQQEIANKSHVRSKSGTRR